MANHGPQRVTTGELVHRPVLDVDEAASGDDELVEAIGEHRSIVAAETGRFGPHLPLAGVVVAAQLGDVVDGGERRRRRRVGRIGCRRPEQASQPTPEGRLGAGGHGRIGVGDPKAHPRLLDAAGVDRVQRKRVTGEHLARRAERLRHQDLAVTRRDDRAAEVGLLARPVEQEHPGRRRTRSSDVGQDDGERREHAGLCVPAERSRGGDVEPMPVVRRNRRHRDQHTDVGQARVGELVL